MIKRLGLVLPLVAIVASACSSGGSATPAASAAAPSRGGVDRGVGAGVRTRVGGGLDRRVRGDAHHLGRRQARGRHQAARPAVGDRQRRHRRRPGHHREPDDAVQDREPAGHGPGHRRLGA